MAGLNARQDASRSAKVAAKVAKVTVAAKVTFANKLLKSLAKVDLAKVICESAKVKSQAVEIACESCESLTLSLRERERDFRALLSTACGART